MMSYFVRSPFIIALLVYGFLAVFVPDMAKDYHAVIIAFLTAAILMIDGLLAAEELRRQRKAHAQRRARYYDPDFLAEASAVANKQYQYNQHRPHDSRLN
jgi:hypothetical protein